MSKRRRNRARQRASVVAVRPPQGSAMVADSRGWLGLLTMGGDTFTGSWQQDAKLPPDKTLSFFAVYACITQIAADIAKLAFTLREHTDAGIWTETDAANVRPFLLRPNHFQTMQQFAEAWLIEKLKHGNAVALKVRDDRGVVASEYVMDWERTTPLVAPDGSVYYQFQTDNLALVPWDTITVPASEVIHDRMNCLFHPLIGVSPLFAAGLAASQGLNIQKNSDLFFKNLSRPGGILTAPGKISDETAARLKREFEQNYRGAIGLGKTLVAGDSLKYEPMAVTPEDSQLVEQLGLSARQVCSAFKVPPFMVGIGDMPGFENVQALTQWYYSACLQAHIEAFERCQDAGLELDRKTYRTEFDLDDLLRMDTKTAAETEGVLVQRGIKAPDEARRRFSLPPVDGGAQPYLQQQNFSLEALAKRDASDDPFSTAKPTPAPAPSAEESAEKMAVRVVALVEPQIMRALAAFAETQADQARQAELERAAREAAEEQIRAAEAAERARITEALDQLARRQEEAAAQLQSERTAREAAELERAAAEAARIETERVERTRLAAEIETERTARLERESAERQAEELIAAVSKHVERELAQPAG